MKRLMLVAFTVLFGAGLLFSASDSKYKSWEIMEVKGSNIYVRFRINIPYTIKYTEDIVNWFKGAIKKETSPRKLKSYQKSLGNYEIILDMLKKNQKNIKAIYVFGDFNGWKTAGSEVPNQLIPSSNPDTYYAKTLVPMIASKGVTLKYKFVIDLGKTYNAQDGTPQEYVYIEDPRNPDKTPDGFGGYNSQFTYK